MIEIKPRTGYGVPAASAGFGGGNASARNTPPARSSRRSIAEGRIYREILNAAKTTKADLIVMGSHHPELKDYLLGPNAAKVMRHADCSVMVVRE